MMCSIRMRRGQGVWSCELLRIVIINADESSYGEYFKYLDEVGYPHERLQQLSM